MTWTSKTFNRSTVSGPPADKDKVAGVVRQHRPAMDKVIDDAKKFSRERQDTISKIKDPILRRSAIK